VLCQRPRSESPRTRPRDVTEARKTRDPQTRPMGITEGRFLEAEATGVRPRLRPETKAKVNRIWPQDRGQAARPNMITSLAGSRIISASTSAKNKSISCEITLNITVILHSHHLKIIRGDATSVSQSSFAISETVRGQAIVSVERE